MKKRILFSLLCALLFIILSGCTKNTETKSVAKTLSEQFSNEIARSNDIGKIAKNISKNSVIKTDIEVEKLNENSYITGFDTEIKDYKSGYAIRPIIGTIPFAAYIFEVDNPEEYEKMLKSNANLAWNICTVADEIQTVVHDNYVFVVMSPKSF